MIPKNHNVNICSCGVCKRIRGESIVHKDDCQCLPCKSKRDGFVPWNKGKKGIQIPWNEGLTKETNPSVRKYSDKMKGIPKSLEHTEKIRNTIKNQYKNGRCSWNKGLSVDDIRVRKNIDCLNEKRKQGLKDGSIKIWNKGLYGEEYSSHYPDGFKWGEQFGSDNPSWQGGKSFEPYTPEFNNHLKEQIRQRDGYICQLCGVEQETGMLLDVHHIDYDKTNNHPMNLLCLHRSCHTITQNDRSIWTSFFNRYQKNRGLLY